MKTIFADSLVTGDELINESFMIQDINRRKTKDGRAFLLGSLRDKTGQVPFIFWDVPDYIEREANVGQIMFVSGRVVSYKDAIQVTVTDFNFSQNPDMADFLPTSKRPREEMIKGLKEIIASLAEPWQSLLSHLLLNDEFLPLYSNAPAARGMHHAYIGGVLEHTLSMVEIAQFLTAHYPHVDSDLLISGTLLHDMGKAIEYTISDGFGFSDDGRLVGHITRGIIMVEKAAQALGNFPEDKLRHLIHLIASHHGTQEWGSPVVPKTLEAILLHQIDLLDSRMQGYYDHVHNNEGSGSWTTKSSPMFGTDLYFSSKLKKGNRGG